MTHDRGLRARRAREGRPAPAAHARPLGGRRPRGGLRSFRRRGFPSMAKVDAEYREYLDTDGRRGARPGPRATCRDDVPATFVRAQRPVGAGRAARARRGARRQRDRARARPPHGAFGHVALGSVTDRLVHSSPVTARPGTARLPVPSRARRCARVTAAYGGVGGCRRPRRRRGDASLPGVGASLRIASFAVWARPAYTTTSGHRLRGRRARASGPQPWSVPRARPSQAVEGLERRARRSRR